MNPRITIIAQGEEVDKPKIQSALGCIEDLNLTLVGQDRSLPQGAAKVITWIGEFIGTSAEIADALVEQVTKQLAGAAITVKVGDIEVIINNANRSQIKDLLEQAIQVAKEMSSL
jgi:hypothetical protein